MTATDDLLRNADAYPARDVVQSQARIAASPFVPHKDQVRGFVYDVKTGRLAEVKGT
jgi:carbonic anhydrase